MDINHLDQSALESSRDTDSTRSDLQETSLHRRDATTNPPKCAWKRKLQETFPEHKAFSISILNGIRLSGLGYRMWKYVKREKASHRIPIMDPFNQVMAGPTMGVPLGGMGGGSVGRGWRGDFQRWVGVGNSGEFPDREGQLGGAGIPAWNLVCCDQFSVYVKRHGFESPSSTSSTPSSSSTSPSRSPSSRTTKGINTQLSPSPTIATVLYPGQPSISSNSSNAAANQAIVSSWEYLLSGNESRYEALFPRAWTTYDDMKDSHGISLTCRQISPVIPHNYKETSYPVGVFEWRIHNHGNTEADVSIMFTFQNGNGGINDYKGGHSNSPFTQSLDGDDEGDDEVVGVMLDHKQRQRISDTNSKSNKPELKTFFDPLTFAIATLKKKDTVVSYYPNFVVSNPASCKELWDQFKRGEGVFNNGDVGGGSGSGSATISQNGHAIGAALAVKVRVPANETRDITFALAWDCPIARFSSGASYQRRYTQFFPPAKSDEISAVQRIAAEALRSYRLWEQEIVRWQEPILQDPDLPDHYKGALFNELYYLVDGGTIWTCPSPSPGESREGGDEEDIGKFAYLEGLEYLMYNTYDVHFYASFALAMLWPKLELSLQRDVAMATTNEYGPLLGPGVNKWTIMHDGKDLPVRKFKCAVPHDIGNPGEDPWEKVNSYCIQDVSRWKDLPCKFVLQIYRDYVITKNKSFLTTIWPSVLSSINYALQFDTDRDGVIDNEGFPDQTYDTWSATGCSAYTGGLWLACLSAAVAMADVLEDQKHSNEFSEILTRGKISYSQKLWNGFYFKYDCSKNRHSDSIMADQLCGQWYALACRLSPIVDTSNAVTALNNIFLYNVKGFAGGTMGAINGVRPPVSLPTGTWPSTPVGQSQIDESSMQSMEVWTGTTYALAATMIHHGLFSQAFEVAKGIIECTYEKYGYHFQTPEAWDQKGRFRACGYMRPLCIWAIQWAWQNRPSHGPIDQPLHLETI